MGKPNEFDGMGVYTDSMIKNAYTYYVKRLISRRPMISSTEFVSMFRINKEQARALFVAVQFKYEMHKKGVV